MSAADGITIMGYSLSEVDEALNRLQIVKYILVVAIAVYVYDYALTVVDEIHLVWPSKFALPKALFFLNRYSPIVDIALLIFVLLVGGSQRACKTVLQTTGYFASAGFLISQMILMMRTWAIYERGRLITAFILLLICADAAVPIAIIHFYNKGVSAIANPSSVYKGCFLTYSNRLIFVDIVLVVLTESSMLFLLIIKARQHFRNSRNRLMVGMYNDGIIYFCFILCTSIANLATLIAAPVEVHNILIIIQRILHSSFCSRVLLHIRGAYTNSAYFHDDSDDITPPARGGLPGHRNVLIHNNHNSVLDTEQFSGSWDGGEAAGFGMVTITKTVEHDYDFSPRRSFID